MWACVCVCFFKQKTAYEVRISDWSSDVCSSDLPALQEQRAVVELDCQQVALAEPLPGKQAVADLRCARAQVIAAVADALQVAVADDAGIGRPEQIGRAHV